MSAEPPASSPPTTSSLASAADVRIPRCVDAAHGAGAVLRERLARGLAARGPRP
jgi:hypothetical protein